MLITMTVLAAIAGLALAVSVGYRCGQRAHSAPRSWRKRTSRFALSRRALDLAVLVAARRIERRFRAEPMVDLVGLGVLAPLQLLRDNVTRMRAYRGVPGW